MKEVIEANPITDPANQMGVSLDDLPELETGDATLDEISNRLFH